MTMADHNATMLNGGTKDKPSPGSIVADGEQYCMAGLPPHPVVASKASGSYIWDLEGNKHIDLIAGYSSINQGHCHPRIMSAMMEQCQKLMLPGYCVYNEHYPALCKKMCDLLGFGMAVATNSGSEGIDVAIRMARKWGYQVKGIPRGEGLILTASANYHGRSMMPLSSSENPKYREDCGPFIPGIGPSVAGGKQVRFGNAEDLEDVLKDHSDKIAAFMIETVEGNAGTIVPPEGYLTEARRLCTKYNVLFIADEIQCGFGRTGYFMAYDCENVKPDIVVLGKSLTGGAYSMGLTLGSKETIGTFKPGQFGSTFAGNPLACACAIAAVDVLIDEKLSERTLAIGQKLDQRLSKIKSKHFAGFRGRGLFFSVLLREDGHRVTGKRWADLLMKRGIMTYHYGDKIRIAPPLTINEADLWHAVDEIEKVLNDIESIEGEIIGHP